MPNVEKQNVKKTNVKSGISISSKISIDQSVLIRDVIRRKKRDYVGKLPKLGGWV